MNSPPAQPSGPDVRQLGDANLPESPFPRGGGQEFRVALTPEVHQEVWRHGTEDTRVEICGVLVGSWARDEDGPFVRVTASIRGEAAQNKFAEVTFTHETWAKINSEMDSRFADLAIVGWYHTHPDFGIFLSDRDRFIQENFFSGAGQIALVVDPIRRTEGVFAWRSGKACMCPYFWVGDRVVLGTAAGDEAEGPQPSAGSEAPAAASRAAAPAPEPSLLPGLVQILAYLSLFLLGVLAAGYRSSWEQNRLTEGVVAHYGIWQGLRPGLHEGMNGLQERVGILARTLSVLSADHEKHLAKLKDKKAADDQARLWKLVRSDLSEMSSRVSKIDSTFRMSPEETAAAERVVYEKLRELSEPPKVIEDKAPKAAPKTEAAKPAAKPAR